MKLYEINAITEYSKKNIARTINPNKIQGLIEKYRKENQINQWWVCYEKDENNNIKVEIKEYEVIE